jgi:hypothetical protein
VRGEDGLDPFGDVGEERVGHQLGDDRDELTPRLPLVPQVGHRLLDRLAGLARHALAPVDDPTDRGLAHLRPVRDLGDADLHTVPSAPDLQDVDENFQSSFRAK